MQESSLNSLYKYGNEPWSCFVARLKLHGETYKVSEEEVFKKLRQENAPDTIRNLFYTIGTTLEILISRIKEYEINSKRYYRKFTRDERQNEPRQNITSETPKLRCYSCNKEGH